MAEKLILNSGAPVVISTEIGNININGHNQLTKITQEQYKALMEKQDFKLWVEKGYIIINAPVRNVEDIINATNEDNFKEQQNEVDTIKLEALANAIMANENIKERSKALEEARKRLLEESEKAEQAGDEDAAELKAAANAKEMSAKEIEMNKEADKANKKKK